MLPDAKAKFESYPEGVRSIMLTMRQLILSVAEENQLGAVEETLKWGEPSYLVKGGSAVRIDWKLKSPDQYCFYFNCKSKLVDTFRELHSEQLKFEGNRAIVLSLNKEPPLNCLSHCIELAMKYQKNKHLPLLGA
ncbi:MULTISPECIES: DUF1801 domain-containing protein [Marinomonas]|uniref:DUF1801 domain-containing protein n=1 Tax=Marinomonas arctica TaxID=383750 RepID=A0A7H1J8X1_9GAMM|nr:MULTISPECIES: DUF1801 domain-containing protein [Marinomonas]MCS7487169.1 hypothetical protein [Marinomonas sp. BSi20414]QNT06937.1 DUF1801 domain-containing protein [Marinomonas arctica]GGN34170.1 hypothetical protein GCM10011350_30330 [Marinomonas arctica]